jgi:ribosome maturation factor RimP
LKEEQIIKLLEERFKEEDLNDCFLFDLIISGNKIAVFVDSDTEMGFDRCRTISRYLENHFDETNAFGEKYTLEVSSPGIGKPLKFKRQYFKNVGRKVEVDILDDSKTVKGVLKSVIEEGIVVEYEQTRKQGKKKIKENVLQEIKHDEIEKIIVKVSF